MADAAVLRAIAGPAGSRLGNLLGAGLEPVAPLRRADGGLDYVVAEVSAAEPDLLAARAGLPEGAALSEAVAVRLRGQGLKTGWGDPVVVADVPAVLELCRARGRSSTEIIRADPSLLPRMEVGAWFDAYWRMRAMRRAAHLVPRPVISALAGLSPRWLAAMADLAFWRGVREQATADEWRRLTSSYVALLYHRFAGELRPGQERIDISPARFARQLRALRLAGFRPLPAAKILAFHAGSEEPLPRRGVAITVDDGLADSVAPLLDHAGWSPQLFVPTGELGGTADWIGGEPLAGWSDLEALASAGVAIGSHLRHHARLSELDPAAREDEIAGSLADLRQRLEAPLEVLAYPHGDHDEPACRAARDAGYRAAYTTEKGRNGAGADVYRLRRVSVHGHDGIAAVLWKVLTGDALPPLWLRLRAVFGRGDR